MKNYRWLVFTLLALATMESTAQQMPMPSAVYEWDMVPVEKTPNGIERAFFNWPTQSFDNFRISAITLASNSVRQMVHHGIAEEGLLLVKEGRLGLASDSKENVVGSRSIVLVPRMASLEIFNAGDGALTFYSIQWRTAPGASDSVFHGLKIFDYEKLSFNKNEKGGRRAIMRAPTALLEELEMHITTLNEGEKSHDPHQHPDEEIIIVLQGKVAEMVNGTAYALGTGSVIFLKSMDFHGIRNIGSGQCEYYAIRWKKTPGHSP